MKNKTIITILGLIIIGLAIYFSLVNNQKYIEIKNNGKAYDCEISTIGSDVLCIVQFEGKTKTRRLSKPHKYIKNGEKYKAYYYPKYKDKFYTAFEEPIIDYIEYNQTTILSFEDGSLIKFEYRVDGKKFKRFQKRNNKLKYDDLTNFKVYYNKKDPSIAYLVNN